MNTEVTMLNAQSDAAYMEVEDTHGSPLFPVFFLAMSFGSSNYIVLELDVLRTNLWAVQVL